MPLRTLSADDELGLARGAVAVVIAWSSDELAPRTLLSVAAHTADAVPIIVLACGDDAEAVAATAEGREILLVAAAAQDAVARAAGVTGKADLLWLAAGVRVGSEYLARLQGAATSDSTVISASAMVGADDTGATIDERARAVAAVASRAYPRVSQLDPRCVLIRRAGLDRAALGGRDPAGSLRELSDRLVALGLQHVVADDVWVDATGMPDSEVQHADLQDERSVLRRTRTVAHAAQEGLSVTVDARALGATGLGGTQVYTVQLILALARSSRARVRAVVPHDLAPFAQRAFASVENLELLPYERAVEGAPMTDVVHRPQQVFTPEDLALLRLLGERIVVTQQDLIAYRDPAYHASADDWWAYRRVTRLALGAADRAVFFSEHARQDVVGEDLLDADRGDVVGIGADWPLAWDGEPSRPEGIAADAPFLVCIGADYAHKNRPFAIALLEALQRRHGWAGRLVLAGASAPHGSSHEEEEELLSRRPDLAAAVTDLGRVEDPERAWLYANCAAVVFPSTYEGFGLIPFEAAQAGVPCLFAPQASLPELAGPEAATLVPWDADASADAVVTLLEDGPERERLVGRLRAAAAHARWEDVVERLLDTYQRALRSPQRASAPRAWQELERERYIVELAAAVEPHKRLAAEYQDAFHDLSRRVDVGLPLIDEGGMLSHAQQRGLMRIGARPLLRRLLLGPVGALGRLGAGDSSPDD